MGDRKTLGQFLEQASFGDPPASSDLRALLLDLAVACRSIARRLADAPLRTGRGQPATPEVSPRTVPVIGGRRAGDDGRRGWIARLRSGQAREQRPAACHLQRGRLVAVLLPVDSPSNLEVNATGGTIFSILRAEAPGQALADNAVWNAGDRRLCSGYALHGPSLVLVLALATGVQAFALDRRTDEFVLTQADLRIPGATDRIAIDASRMRFWSSPIRRYIDECLSGQAGRRGKDFQFQWLGSMVADAHRILRHGGIFICAGEGRSGTDAQRSWLLQEAAPISFIIERAGGRASTGTSRILDCDGVGPPFPTSLVFGSAEEIERLEAYHGNEETGLYDAPLFAERGLFRSSV